MIHYKKSRNCVEDKESQQTDRETDRSVVLVFCVIWENPPALAVKHVVNRIHQLHIFSRRSYVIRGICATASHFWR